MVRCVARLSERETPQEGRPAQLLTAAGRPHVGWLIQTGVSSRSITYNMHGRRAGVHGGVRTRCSAAADGIEPRDAEVVIIVTAPAKGDRGLRESERHVAKGAGVWGQGEGGRGVGPRVYPTAYPVTSHLIPTRARCPCVALEGKAIVLRHWLMLSEVVIIVCRHRQPSGRLTRPPPLS